MGLTNCRIDVSRNNIDTYSTTEQQYSEDLRLSGNAVTAVPQNRSGWQYQNGAVYYFTDAEGHYVTGTTTIDGETYTFSSLGVLDGTEELEPVTQDEGEEDSTPTLPSGTDENPIPGSWQLSGGEYYLVDDSGRMLTGWQKYDTAWYYMDESGVMQTGWLQLGDTWYYLYDWGGMATGWYKVGNTWYYADSSGKMLSGQWLELDGTWYYLNQYGSMVTGWLQLSGKWYYLDSSGAMVTGWQEIGGETYYMSTRTGACATGWNLIDDVTYYFDPVSCAMARDTTINGYYVDENGVYTAQ